MLLGGWLDWNILITWHLFDQRACIHEYSTKYPTAINVTGNRTIRYSVHHYRHIFFRKEYNGYVLKEK